MEEKVEQKSNFTNDTIPIKDVILEEDKDDFTSETDFVVNDVHFSFLRLSVSYNIHKKYFLHGSMF